MVNLRQRILLLNLFFKMVNLSDVEENRRYSKNKPTVYDDNMC